MSRAFDKAFAFVVEAEGGATITNDPDDPGGLTKWGVSQRAYPDVDIANLTKEQAKEIYRRDYWDRCHCDRFQQQLALAIFDAAINQGPHKAIRLLQRALRVTEDGVVGEETEDAANRAYPGEVLIEYLSHRAAEYARLNPKYHRGWFARLFRLQRATWSLP
jgi:lysozyme family protein